MEHKNTNVTVSINRHCINKTRSKGEQSEWVNVQMSLEELIEGVVRKGHAFSPSLFKNGHRNAENAFGGDTVVIDEDEGLDPAVIAELPVFKDYGIAIFPSSSSGVVADKEGVDGRFRSRVLFKVARPFNTGKVKSSIQLERNVVHHERIAISEYIYERFCKEAGLEGLQDSCGKTIAQMMYGNDGKTPIEVLEGNKVVLTYPCSTHDWLYLNDGCMSKDTMAEVVARSIEQNPERLQPKQRRSSSDLEKDYDIALWILQHDVLSEDVLVAYDTWCEVGMACKGISEDLMEPFLETTSRFSDRKARLQWDAIYANWQRFSETSAYSLGTIIGHADDSTNGQWRYTCPAFGKQKKQHFSPCFQLLRSHRQGTKGFNNIHPYQ